MNKTAVKNYAVWAREKLISDVKFKAGLIGITDKGISAPLPQSTGDAQFFDIGTKDYSSIHENEIAQRNALISAIQAKEKALGYAEAFNIIVEQIAYTWFNRLAAIRFMEVNDYLPCRMRVLSSETEGKNEPDIVTSPFDSDMEFTDEERDEIYELKDKSKNEDLFRKLFVKECGELHNILPGLFSELGDYMELMLNVSYNDENSVVYKLVHDIPEADFNVSDDGQIEIIGWLYQYYNIEAKECVFANLKKNKKIEKEDIPAATQLFTPDWIVRYMVENSLGRLWIEHLESISGVQFPVVFPHTFRDERENIQLLKSEWKYYLDEAEQEESVKAQLAEIRKQYKDIKPEDIRFIDPCMGSGHILVYAFELLMKIYTSVGYTERDAAVSIIQNNLYGLDIDPRARQLAYFALMMKGRQYNRRIFTSDVVPNVYVTENSANITDDDIEFVANGNAAMEKDMKSLRDDLRYADEFGSLIDVKTVDFDAIFARLNEIEHAEYSDLVSMSEQLRCPDIIVPFVKQAQTMAQKYDVVCTNPPYMGGSGMNAKLSNFVKKNYPDSKADTFACFIEKGLSMTVNTGFNCMVTMQSWMFLSSFEKLREKLLTTKTITNLMHMENMVMGIAFGTAVTSFRNTKIKGYRGTYNHIKYEDIVDDKPKDYPIKGNRFSQVSTDNFFKIPGSPVAYWVSNQFFNLFENIQLGDIAKPRQGMATTNNNLFLRFWYEVDNNKIGLSYHNLMDTENGKHRWFPYNKGGDYRKWYGNQHYVVNWYKNGLDLKEYTKDAPGGRMNNMEYYFMPSDSWSKITSGKFAARFFPNGFIFDVAGCSIFSEDNLFYLLGILNSTVAESILKAISPTLNYEVEHIKKIPIILSSNQTNLNATNNLVEENINICKADWDSFETSWDFERHPLVRLNESLWDATAVGATMHYYYGKHIKVNSPLELCYMLWQGECNERFNKLKANEEELNRIFIDIYGLQDELTPEVEDKDVTVRKADLQREIRSLLSYAVGCMFGRYSLDCGGLAYAGGEWDDSKYRTFIPDKDNCIPITDEAYFEDDIVGLLCGWLKKVYGTETLEENLDFIAAALDCKGNTSRDKIRSYFLTDFIKDHIRIYQKRPIYWLFDSGKQNGFKALVYMHRWNADTVGNVRVEYLHKVQKVYEQEIERMQDTIENSGDSREIARAAKRREKLLKQQKEVREYDEKIAHVALSRVDIDLDDGVKVNYEKVQKGKDGKSLEILAAIK